MENWIPLNIIFVFIFYFDIIFRNTLFWFISENDGNAHLIEYWKQYLEWIIIIITLNVRIYYTLSLLSF